MMHTASSSFVALWFGTSEIFMVQNSSKWSKYDDYIYKYKTTLPRTGYNNNIIQKKNLWIYVGFDV